MIDLLSMTAAQVEAMPEAEAAEVLDAWVRAKKIELPQEVSRSKKKGHARLAKKALYQLKSAGVSAGVVAAANETPAAEVVEEKAEEFPAVISSMAGTGEFAVFFARPIRGGGVELFQGVVSDELGVLEITYSEAGRGAYRKRMKALDEKDATPVVKVPMERMLREMAHALALNEISKTPLTEEMQNVIRRLGVTPKLSHVEIPVPDASDLEIAAAGAALHGDADISEWLPSEPALRALAETIETVRTDATLNEQSRAAKFREQAVAATATFFTPEIRKRYAYRLWHMAEVFQATGRPGQAELARGESRRLFHTNAPTFFGQRLFLKAIEAMQKASGEAEAAAKAALSKPGALSPPKLVK